MDPPEAVRAAPETTVVLHPGLAVRGLVLDDRDRPVPGATVSIHGLPSLWDPCDELHTDLAGRFGVDVPHPGPWEVRVGTLASSPGHYAPALVRAGEEEVVLRPTLPRLVAGRLVDPEGRPVPGARIRVEDAATRDSWSDTTDAEGRFSVECAHGEEFRVDVTSSFPAPLPGSDPGHLPERDLAVRERRGVVAGTDDLLLVAERTYRITGRVLGPDGRPVPGADVGSWAEDGSGGAEIVETRGDGSFEIGPCLAGPWTIEAELWRVTGEEREEGGAGAQDEAPADEEDEEEDDDAGEAEGLPDADTEYVLLLTGRVERVPAGATGVTIHVHEPDRDP